MIIESKQEAYLLADMLHTLSCYENMSDYEDMKEEVERQVQILDLLPEPPETNLWFIGGINIFKKQQ